MPQFLKELKQKILSDLKYASQNPQPKHFLTVFVRFFVISAIAFFGTTLVLITLFIFVLAPFISKKVQNFKNYDRKFYTQVFPQRNELAGIKKDVAQLKKLYYQLADKNFWENNKKEYTYDFPHYQVKLTNLGAYMGKWEMERKYVFGLSVCPNNTDNPCFANDKNDVNLEKFGFDSDEVIKDFSVDAFSISGVEGIIFAGNILTDKGTYPFVVYPTNAGSNMYDYVNGMPITDYTGVEFDRQTNTSLIFTLKSEDGAQDKTIEVSSSDGITLQNTVTTKTIN